jgi:hypothetical protein
MKLLPVSFLLALLLVCHNAEAGTDPGDNHRIDSATEAYVKARTSPRFYIGNGFDLLLLSTALSSNDDESMSLTVPRFTIGFNFGFNFHYDFNLHAGIYSGIGIKNIGYIEKFGDVKIKRRVYTAGIPLGFKIGDLRNRKFVFFGGGVDFPFNYREKRFTKRSSKLKQDEWFGDQTSRVMPYLFAGLSFEPGLVVKLQYYPGNFLNPDYKFNPDPDLGPVPSQPYKGKQVHLLLLTVGIDIHYNQWRIQEREYREYRRKLDASRQ